MNESRHLTEPAGEHADESVSVPLAVPRAGLGHDEAWRDYQMKHSLAVDEAETPSAEVTSAEVTDVEFPDPATVPELAPLAAVSAASNGSGPPPGEYSLAEAEDENPTPHDGEQDLWSHLSELRERILHSIAGVLLASVVTWNYGQDISEFFANPIRHTIKSHNVTGNLVTHNPMEGFLIYFQITLVSAILLSAPWILYQMWRFIEPALTQTERRYTLVLVPFSSVLFFGGCALGYLMSPLFFEWFLAFQPRDTLANFGYSDSVVLLAKMLLAFGICFQVPVVTIFLHKIGLVSRNFLIEYWRHAVILIFVMVAIVTPTWDPLSLTICAVPPCLLYGLSIWMVKWL